MTGLDPFRSSDPAVVRKLVERDGVAVLTGRSCSPEDAVEAGHDVFASDVVVIPEPAEVRAGGVRDKTAATIDETMPLPPHTDGFAYGDLYPDYFLLACSRSSDTGGESFVVDGHSVLADFARRTGGRETVTRMSTVVIDQTEPGMRGSLTPLIERTTEGRLMLRRFPFQKPAPESTDVEGDQAMIDAWHEAVRAAGERANRFKVQTGEIVVFDNYRMMHGRDPYTDPERLMWRVWVWTTAARGVPHGQLHSDSRFASTPH